VNRLKLLAGLFALDVVLFALSGLPAFKDADHGVEWVVGGAAWMGGLLCTRALIVLAVLTLVQSARDRRNRAV